MGKKVCKATPSNNDNVQVWCVVATGKASKCFRFAPHFSSTEHCDTCIVIAPLSNIDGGNILDRQHWITKYDQNLLRKAPKYYRGDVVPVSNDGAVGPHVIVKYDWTYLGLHTGWIYQLEGKNEWVTESYLDSIRENARQETQKPVVGDSLLSTTPGQSPATIKKQKKKEAMKRANALRKSQKSKILTLKNHVKRLHKQLRKQQLARLKEQVKNYNLRVRVKEMKEEAKIMAAEKEAMLTAQAAITPSRRRSRKHKA